MLTKEKRTVLSVITGIICTLLSVCLYGFTVGGEYISFKYLLYITVTSLLITSLAFLFVFGKKIPKKLFFKELYAVIVLVIAALQLLVYQPLNLLTAEDEGKEYETEITDIYLKFNDVFFADEEGTSRKVKFYSIITYDDGLLPEPGGKMIVRETVGGFNCKHFEIVKITYSPTFS